VGGGGAQVAACVKYNRPCVTFTTELDNPFFKDALFDGLRSEEQEEASKAAAEVARAAAPPSALGGSGSSFAVTAPPPPPPPPSPPSVTPGRLVVKSSASVQDQIFGPREKAIRFTSVGDVTAALPPLPIVLPGTDTGDFLVARNGSQALPPPPGAASGGSKSSGASAGEEAALVRPAMKRRDDSGNSSGGGGDDGKDDSGAVDAPATAVLVAFDPLRVAAYEAAAAEVTALAAGKGGDDVRPSPGPLGTRRAGTYLVTALESPAILDGLCVCRPSEILTSA